MKKIPVSQSVAPDNFRLPSEAPESAVASLRSDIEAIISLVDSLRNVPGTVPRCSLDPLKKNAVSALEKLGALQSAPRQKG